MPALAEAYRLVSVDFSRPRDIVGSKAFNLEYLPPMSSDKSLRTDIISYLGEYRFKIPKFEYSLYLVNGEKGSFIADSQGNSMEDAADRAIFERTMRGEEVHREIHERRGLTNLKNILLSAKQNDGIAWGSPPGPKAEGYGAYGFVYSGKVEGEVALTTKTGQKVVATELKLNAIRVENPTIDEYNKAFSQITGKDISYNSADEYLASPVSSLQDITEKSIDEILIEEFSFTPDEEEQGRFEDAINIMGPLIDKVVYAIQNNRPNSEKIELFYALENYAIALKEGSVQIEPGLSYGLGQDVDTVVANFGRFKPPVATGSCGSTGSLISNRLFSSLSILGGIFESNDDAFECPKCAYTTTRPVGDQCPSCKLTKEQFMEEGGIVCD